MFKLFYVGNSTISESYYPKQIKITSTKTIAGTYDFSNGSLAGKNPTSGSSQTITFNCLYNNQASSAKTIGYRSDSTYPYVVVMAPGTQQTLTVEYTLVNKTNNTETKIKTAYKAKDFNENTYYLVNVDLSKYLK